MIDMTPAAFLIGVLVVGVIILLVAMATRNSPRALNAAKYRSKWMTIEQSLQRDDPSSYQLSVLHADKLLDQALRERGVRGATMGERMKNQKETWTSANSVWSAHKLRNHIAHETDAKVTYDQARQALAGFKQALKDLRAI